MQLPLATEDDAQRVIDDLLVIKRVMEKAKGDRFRDYEIAGHPDEIRLGFRGVPIFIFGAVGYVHHGEGMVSESRIVNDRHLANATYDARGTRTTFELSPRGRHGPDLGTILERAVQRGDPDLN